MGVGGFSDVGLPEVVGSSVSRVRIPVVDVGIKSVVT